MFQTYRDLEAYKKAFTLAVALHKYSLRFPKYEQYGGLADQIRRCSKSICANIGEGLSKRTTAVEQKRFLGMAMGSCEETRVWLDFCREFGYLKNETYQKFFDGYEEVGRMLSGLMKRRT